jgi:hypothetical protein
VESRTGRWGAYASRRRRPGRRATVATRRCGSRRRSVRRCPASRRSRLVLPAPLSRAARGRSPGGDLRSVDAQDLAAAAAVADAVDGQDLRPRGSALLHRGEHRVDRERQGEQHAPVGQGGPEVALADVFDDGGGQTWSGRGCCRRPSSAAPTSETRDRSRP